ncbi:hypothetical protein C8J57DRAFT_1706460 [Mycena rebaudengoi]|nr:hypothetical protein C8J57DRAFT_1706460 [Mycena rebaudengoi]
MSSRSPSGTSRSPRLASFPVHRSNCGHKGCGYVFEYSGQVPFQALATLVKAHVPNCRSQNNCAPKRKPWERPPNARLTWPLKTRAAFRCEMDSDDEEGPYGEYPDADSCATQHPENCFLFPMPAPPLGMPTTASAIPLPHVRGLCPPMTDPSVLPSTRIASGAMFPAPLSPRVTHSRSRCTEVLMYPSSPTKEKKRASIKNSRRKTTGKTASLRTGKASRKPLPPRAKKLRTTKKTAHTEEERKAILENDVYTSSVDVHQVTCRGCGRTIKTDRRSTYYPGLWEKHRERCRGVVKMEDEKGRKDATAAEAETSTPIASTSGTASSRASSILTSQPTESDTASLFRSNEVCIIESPLNFSLVKRDDIICSCILAVQLYDILVSRMPIRIITQSLGAVGPIFSPQTARRIDSNRRTTDPTSAQSPRETRSTPGVGPGARLRPPPWPLE